ncbi:MAG: hypothetical protein J5779_01520 [Clostridia bacterium]|nr:hypothetical protein [Clostridia bacterium]
MLFLGSFVSALVDVLAIIGIIVVGGFLIFFLGDLVLSVLDPDYKRFGKKEKTEEKFEEVKKLPAATEKVEALSFVPQEKVEEQEEFTFAEEPVKEEEIKEIEKAKEDALADLRAEEENFKANMLKAIEERKAQKQEKESEFNQFFFDDEDLSIFDADEQSEEPEVETEEAEEPEEDFNGLEIAPETEEVEEISAPEAEEVEEAAEEETAHEVEELKKQLEEQRRKFEEEKLALINANDKLAKKLEENTETVVAAPAGSLEEYEAKLEELKARLANNEKELRKVKKEYLPLRKVARTLESDERKLRRKEAIVAKQKVVLYGVNNIGEIDEEKAKKLEEDLDILEGFRLSVQHCQEVMNANKERYPILENTYNILTENTEIIKKDIAEVEENIAKLKNDNE